MDARTILDRLDQLLEEERAAVRSLDGARVRAAAEEKLALVRALAAVDQAERAKLAQRMKDVVAQLRRNGVLIVHARGIVGEILRVRVIAMSPAKRLGSVAAPISGARLSIRG